MDKVAEAKRLAESDARKHRLEKLGEDVEEEERKLRQSREALERKARLYDKYKSGELKEGMLIGKWKFVRVERSTVRTVLIAIVY